MLCISQFWSYWYIVVEETFKDKVTRMRIIVHVLGKSYKHCTSHPAQNALLSNLYISIQYSNSEVGWLIGCIFDGELSTWGIYALLGVFIRESNPYLCLIIHGSKKSPGKLRTIKPMGAIMFKSSIFCLPISRIEAFGHWSGLSAIECSVYI